MTIYMRAVLVALLCIALSRAVWAQAVVLSIEVPKARMEALACVNAPSGLIVSYQPCRPHGSRRPAVSFSVSSAEGRVLKEGLLYQGKLLSTIYVPVGDVIDQPGRACAVLLELIGDDSINRSLRADSWNVIAR